ncbi:MAG: hypothetical protein K2P20_06185 [Oscillospiraceae bacterium]|nr:hypothetical protein [Oscillospiraceae bacterium]
MNKTGKKEPVWGPFLHLLRVTKLPYVWILVYTLFGLFQSQLNLIFPDYSQKITAGDVSTPTLAVMFAVVIGSSLLEGAINAVSGVTIAKISLRFRESVWGRVLRLPVSYYDSHMPRELINRVTEDTTLLSDNLARIPNSIVSCVYSLAGTFFMLFSYHKTLVVAELVIIPPCWWAARFSAAACNFCAATKSRPAPPSSPALSRRSCSTSPW